MNLESDGVPEAMNEALSIPRILNDLARDKVNLDIFWLKDDSLDDIDSLPPPDEIALEIVENLQAALEAFQSVADELAAGDAER